MYRPSAHASVWADHSSVFPSRMIGVVVGLVVLVSAMVWHPAEQIMGEQARLAIVMDLMC